MARKRPKPLVWIASSKPDLKSFPAEVQDAIGYALHLAQESGKHPATKPLKGFGGAGVLEVIEDHDGDTYRAVYTVKFAGVVYVLHAFQKKSQKTARRDIGLARARYREAKALDEE